MQLYYQHYLRLILNNGDKSKNNQSFLYFDRTLFNWRIFNDFDHTLFLYLI